MIWEFILYVCRKLMKILQEAIDIFFYIMDSAVKGLCHLFV